MEPRKLGKLQLTVNPLGMGGWAIGGPWTWADGAVMGWGEVDDAESIRAIHTALDLGISFFDTAANYGAGHSERILGKALEGRRERAVIATKFGHIIDEAARIVADDDDLILQNLRQDCENSLRRLGTDYIDIYQLHAGEYDTYHIPALVDMLEDLVQAGKIRAYGWSTDDVNRAAHIAGGQHCTAIQFSLNVLRDAPQMLELVELNELIGINKHPLASGTLTGKFHDRYEFPADDIRHGMDWTSDRGRQRLAQAAAVRDVLTSGGRSMAQGALAWIWGRSPKTLPIPGFKTAAQVRENAGALTQGPLTHDEMRQLDEILERSPIQG